MRSTQTRRRILALAALTSVAVVTGSIAVADAPDADDIAADALASSRVLDEVQPSDVDVDEVVARARTVREPLVPSRTEVLAADPTDSPTSEPTTSTGSAQTWVASWYGPGFHGNLTANGERFDQWAMTAAHKSLPFGTELRITNPATGSTVVVRVNDRGPFVGGRDIDLSRGAAEALGVSGVSRVQVQVL